MREAKENKARKYWGMRRAEKVVRRGGMRKERKGSFSFGSGSRKFIPKPPKQLFWFIFALDARTYAS